MFQRIAESLVLLVQFLFQQVVDLACFLPDLGKVLLNGGVVLQIFPPDLPE